MPALETRRMIRAAFTAAEGKKAEDLRVLELDPADSGFTDYFLIASASNERQAQAIADEIERRLKSDFHTTPNSVEGLRGGQWILMDYVDFVVHVFLKEKRAYYDIERLRKTAQIVDPNQWEGALRKRRAAAARTTKTKKTRRAASKPPARVKKLPSAKRPGRKTRSKTV